jgi:hypothetical protein
MYPCAAMSDHVPNSPSMKRPTRIARKDLNIALDKSAHHLLTDKTPDNAFGNGLPKSFFNGSSHSVNVRTGIEFIRC